MRNVVGVTPGIDALVLVRRNGEIVSAEGGRVDLLRQVASFAIGVHDVAERLAETAGRGAVEWTLVHASGGDVVAHDVDEDHILLALSSDPNALGSLVHDLAWCVNQLRTEATWNP